MEAAAAKASPRKDSTEKQPAVEVLSDFPKAVFETLVGLLKKQSAEGFSSFHSSTSTRRPCFATEAAATGHNTVRFRVAEKFNGLPLTVSSKRPITAIEKDQKLKLYGPTVFDANAKDPYGVADVSHVVFPANTLTGSSSSSAPFDQMLGYQFALANPDGALDGGCAVFADEANDARAVANAANNVDD